MRVCVSSKLGWVGGGGGRGILYLTTVEKENLHTLVQTSRCDT